MTKVRCKYCVKCIEGRCTSKKNVSVSPTKKRVCNKYVANVEVIKKELEKVKNNKMPVYRYTFRYYEKEHAKAVRQQKKKNDDVVSNAEYLSGPEMVRVR